MNKPKKYFGQNFLHDTTIIEKIISVVAPKKSDNFVEIGPGEGAVTLQLLPLIKHLDAIELDRDLIPVLQAKCASFSNFNLYQHDVLLFDLTSLKENAPLRVFGNLPYNISTPVLFYLNKYVNLIDDLHFMLQLEVAERLTAEPNSKNYGRLSVMMQYYFKAELMFDVAATAFYPVPKVTSAFIKMTPIREKQIIAQNEMLFADVVRTAFNQRRKTIRNCLRIFVNSHQLEKLNISPDLRPEQLSIQDFVAISNLINNFY